jgi:glycosyltransferase involved in cell wall biosynthesis
VKLGVNTLFYLPGEVGGTETYLLELLRALLAGGDFTEVSLFANAENEAILRDLAAEQAAARVVPLGVRARCRPARILAEQTRLRRAVRRAGCEVLWSPGYTPLLWPPCPQVTTLHDLQYRTHPEDLAWPHRLATDFLVRAAVRHSRLLLTGSTHAATEIRRELGVPAARLRMVPHGVDAAFAQPTDPAPWRARLRAAGLGEAEPYLLCVAFSHPHKNLHGLVEAFGRLHGEIPHRLVVIGRPQRGEPAFQAAWQRLPDPARVVRLEARVPGEALIAAFQGADLFVFPSLFEGFGLPVLEAMLAGVPVVTTDATCLPEVSGGHAFTAVGGTPPALAARMREALQEPADRRAARVAAARAHAAAFTWARAATGTAAVLRAAAAG